MMQRASLLQKIWSEALPFVARSPEMKVNWLVGVLAKKSLTEDEIAPYIHLLLNEYQNTGDLSKNAGGNNNFQSLLPKLFSKIPRNVVVELIECTGIYDIPLLLEIIKPITVEEAVLILQKTTPAYEKRPMEIYDLVFQAVHNCDEHLLEKAKEKMLQAGNIPKHFNSEYDRFQEILKDKEVLNLLFPQAKVI